MHNNEMVYLNCFFLLLLIAYFYLKLTEDLFTIASGRMIEKIISPGRYAGNNDIFYFGLRHRGFLLLISYLFLFVCETYQT